MNRSEQHRKQKLPYPYTKELARFTQSLAALVQNQVEARSRIPRGNMLRFQHGANWLHRRMDKTQDTGILKRQTSENVIEVTAIVENQLTELPRLIDRAVSDLLGQLQRDMYRAVNEAAMSCGNLVSYQEAGSLKHGFLEMLKKVDFGVDEEGGVTLPEIHAPPEIVKKMLDELEKAGPEFREEVKAIKKRKSEDAKRNEEERLSKYKK